MSISVGKIGMCWYKRYKCALNMTSSEEDTQICDDSSSRKRRKFGGSRSFQKTEEYNIRDWAWLQMQMVPMF